ncbi:peptide ABC transporter [Desulfuribacillus stibiiarsenatis]|uniref:Peptide ABC transporter n=1 Tax=Desulfuribacillus stibiiarsenatis TaxID=1390249 RepID=A0A1E5L8H2_9FIRM|nr:ATP-binding cassette domain-containing protein [Desulfuribacillus stibiiarsenatis]OEH86452.1 peptide ABC transporter [Desulfuribacillus stibiiarsenatis]
MLVDAKHIGYRYRKDRWVLKDVSMHVEEGEIVGLVGPSGYGKTTLGRILAGYLQPHEGQLTFQGKPYQQFQGYHPIQIVLQHPEKAVNPRWKMKEILTEGWSPNQELLTSLGIEEEWLSRWPNELSGGELQRFCVARALGPQTKLLIADEMTTMLDAVTQAQIWHTVLDIVKQRKMGLIVISHDKHLINRMSTRVVDLQKINQA